MADELRAAESVICAAGAGVVVCISLVGTLGNHLLHPRSSFVDDRGI